MTVSGLRSSMGRRLSNVKTVFDIIVHGLYFGAKPDGWRWDNMSSVRKRILPSGEIRWQVDYKDLQGKRRSKQFKTKKAATDFEIMAGGEIKAGTHVPDSVSVDVGDAGELWLAKSEKEGLEPSTLRQYRQHLEHHIAPLIGEVK